ncbi:MAG: SMP-30/gluconolactonase/LRE family protein [Alphaproteobacteria bacterium]|nr:SMP-30/gluconolactonase/LRE family protein [Alphaproteobacteria bacterium]
MNATQTVFDTNPCTLGEGPTFDPENNKAWWFDILGRRLFEKNLDTATTTTHDLPIMGSALAAIDPERQLLVGEHGLYVRTISDGTLALHMPLEANNGTTRSNDCRVHPCGAFWIGTMSKQGEPAAGSIYHYFRGELRRLFSDITVSNAICFSADGATGYYSDTATGQIMRIDLDPATGLPTGTSQIFLDKQDQVAGSPDGAVVDADGLLWNARWGGGCVSAFDASGTCVETIGLPVSNVTCPAFIGGGKMIATSAISGLSEQQIAEQRLAGQTFLLDREFNTRYEPKVVL